MTAEQLNSAELVATKLARLVQVTNHLILIIVTSSSNPHLLLIILT